MGGRLLKLGLLLLSMTCSSSMDTNSTINPEMETDGAQALPVSTMNGPLAVPTNSTFNEIETIDNNLMAGHRSSKESKVTTDLETSTAVEKTQEETSTNVTDAMTIRSNTNGPMVAPLNANTPSGEETPLIDTSTEQPVMSSTSIKESKTTPGQDKTPTGKRLEEETTSTAKASVTIASTTREDPSSATFSTRPVNGSITIPAGLPFPSPDDNEMTTTSQPSVETGTSKSLVTQGPNKNKDPKNPEVRKDDRKKIIVIVVFMVILLLILVTIVVMLVRKRRRGFQDFSRHSSKRQDVWAGQVPELGEGKVTEHPMGVENGTSRSKTEPGQEQEMVTFISAEKKEDSVAEVNELGKGDTSEKKPLLEDTSQGSEEPERPPVQEQIPSPAVE